MRHMGRCVVLSARVTSGPVTALINVTETAIFPRRYLKINNSTVNEYFITKFCGYFKDIQNPLHIILLGCVKIWHFCPILSVDYFFPGHSVQTHQISWKYLDRGQRYIPKRPVCCRPYICCMVAVRQIEFSKDIWTISHLREPIYLFI